MTGRVSGRRALLHVVLRLIGRPDLSIEFVVDTGFTGFLTLPPAAVTALGLPRLGRLAANLADDQNVWVPVHAATILWHGRARTVRVLAMGKRPLVGTALLDDNCLGIEFVEDGEVTIRARS
jgi:clan AA aspartic protease